MVDQHLEGIFDRLGWILDFFFVKIVIKLEKVIFFTPIGDLKGCESCGIHADYASARNSHKKRPVIVRKWPVFARLFVKLFLLRVFDTVPALLAAIIRRLLHT